MNKLKPKSKAHHTVIKGLINKLECFVFYFWP